MRARLITYTPNGYRSELTGLKDATPVSAAMTKLSTVGWNFAQVCAEFNGVQGELCAVIHR